MEEKRKNYAKVYTPVRSMEFKRWMVKHGIGHQRAAEMFGLSISRIMDYERGKSAIPWLVGIAMEYEELIIEYGKLQADYDRLEASVKITQIEGMPGEKEKLQKFREINEANAEARRNAGIKRNLAWMDEENDD